MNESFIHTIEDLSLICCSVMCCLGFVSFFFMGTIGRLLTVIVGSVAGGSGIMGLLGFDAIGDILEELFAVGSEGADDPPNRRR